MKKILLPLVVAMSLASPSLAQAPRTESTDQAVFRTTETIIVTNDDGSQSAQTITTVYYFFGYE